MRWFEKPEVLSYIVDAYQGTDEHGKRLRFRNQEPEARVIKKGEKR